MKGKKSIVIYLDQAQVFKTLPDELAAALIRYIVEYCNEEGEETPDPEDPVLSALFLPFKLFLKRDLKKWEVRQIQNKINGAKGGRPRKDGAKNQTKPKITQPVINETQKKALMVNGKLLIDNSNTIKKENIEKKSGFSFGKSLRALGVEETLVNDFLKNRKLKRLANTETAFKMLEIELNKIEIPINDLMVKIVSKGWGSFKASWELEDQKKEKNFGGKKRKKPPSVIIDEVKRGVYKSEYYEE